MSCDKNDAWAHCGASRCEQQKFDPGTFALLERELGRSFTLDAAANDDGRNALCKHYGSPSRTFLSIDCSGHTVWLNPPPQKLFSFLQHYRRCKEHDSSTSACVVVPARKGRFRSLLNGMTLQRRFTTGTQLYQALDSGCDQPPALADGLELWYDPPLTLASQSPRCCVVDSDARLDVFAAKLSDASVRVLPDSGATHCFIAASLTQKLGLAVQPTAFAPVKLADATSAPILGECRARLRMGSFGAEIRLLVIPTLTASADIVLGQNFLKRYRAVLQPALGELRLTKATGHAITLRAFNAPEPAPQTPLPSFMLMDRTPVSAQVVSPKRAFREMTEKDARTLLVIVKGTVAPPSSDTVALHALEFPPDIAKNTELTQILNEFPEVFAPLTGLPPERGVHHTIPLEPGAHPVSRSQFRLSQLERLEVEKQVTDLLEKGFIRPSTSPYGAPILFVAKKTGELRMCIDYRALNKITVKNRYPLPRIDDTLDKLSGSTLFTALDLASGYHQLRITPEDIPKSAFTTPLGHFEWLVLPFGLCNAPATFQSAMNRMLAPFLNSFVTVYLDDILIFSKNAEDHARHLRLVLDVLRKNQLHVKLSKCEFWRSEVKYLGHIVGSDGIRMDPKKVDAIRNWPVPKDMTELRSFVGLANYFRRFIAHFSSLAAPLTSMFSLSRLPEVWPSQAIQAFENLKKSLSTDVLLHYPDFDRPFEVVSDASLNGTGAVLMQDSRPVAFTSKKLSPAERNYSTGEQELLGVVNALREWRCYLLSTRAFTLVTDHHPLTYLKTQANLSRRQARWVEFLEQFNFDWLYRPGRLNVVADALSRHPSLAAAVVCATSTSRNPPNDTLMTRIIDAAGRDTWFQNPANTSKLLSNPRGFYQREGGECEYRVVIPNDPDLKREIISRSHSDLLAGHPGRDRTIELIERTFWWPTLRADVADYVAMCDSCQRNKAAPGKTAGLSHPLPIPERPWQSVSMDFIVGLPQTKKGHNAITVFVDRLTKMVHLRPCKKTMDAEETADLFFDAVTRLHGMPETIVSDRDSKFTGAFFPALLKRVGTKQNMSTAFHPETDGQTERMNRILGDMLRNYVDRDPVTWDKFLGPAEFAMNNLKNRSVGSTPFYLNYGFHPRTPLQLELGDSVPASKHYADTYAERLAMAKKCMLAAQDRAKAYVDKNRKHVEYAVGDLVLLSTKNLAVQQGSRKLMPKWIGPFPIDKMINPVAARLTLPPEYRFHNVFHVSLLRHYRTDGTVQPPKAVDFDPGTTRPVWIAERILDHETRKLRTRTLTRYLVKWEGFGHEHDTWVDDASFVDRNPIDVYLATRSDRRADADA